MRKMKESIKYLFRQKLDLELQEIVNWDIMI